MEAVAAEVVTTVIDPRSRKSMRNSRATTMNCLIFQRRRRQHSGTHSGESCPIASDSVVQRGMYSRILLGRLCDHFPTTMLTCLCPRLQPRYYRQAPPRGALHPRDHPARELRWQSRHSSYSHSLVPRQPRLVDDHPEERHSPIPSLCKIPKVPRLRDERRKHQPAGGRVHDSTSPA